MVLVLSGCGYCLGVGAVWVWVLSWCGCCLSVGVVWVWVLSVCGCCLGVGVVWVWVLSGCGSCLGVFGCGRGCTFRSAGCKYGSALSGVDFTETSGLSAHMIARGGTTNKSG